ncbi:MAG: hypothetical protein ACK56F_22500, partial [bacterium]
CPTTCATHGGPLSAAMRTQPKANDPSPNHHLPTPRPVASLDRDRTHHQRWPCAAVVAGGDAGDD